MMELEGERRRLMKCSTPYRLSMKFAQKLPWKKRGVMGKRHISVARPPERPPNFGYVFRPPSPISLAAQPRDASYVLFKCTRNSVEDEATRLASLPLSTVIVRWQLKLFFPPFNVSELKFIMSGFGEVLSVPHIDINSALVVFRDLQSAQQAVNSKFLGNPTCRLSCQWLFPVLAQPNIFAAVKDLPTSSHGRWRR
ncbi:uncharacterized protein LOC143294713 [Babylonia areolata]|uniref:uncharacterized protein LOC143294713 n=1 Tax=Babylonia areolata TaxID=304850 RepID=UPI003FD1DAAE